MTALRLLCFNIHGGRSRDGQRDLSRVHDLMEEYKIDIGVFQEMETRASLGGKLADIKILAGPDRPYCLPGGALKEGAEWYGNLLVSRYPIICSSVHALGTSAKLEPRNAVDALLDTPLGKIRVVGTHLSLSLPARWLEIGNLLKMVSAIEEKEKTPWLLMGDINEWRPTSRLLRHLNRLMTAVPGGPTFPSPCPVFRLDRVWHDFPGMKITAKVIRTRQARVLSDHLPVLIEVLAR
jgi:endonuclease/exonuclease/phosphatase family metal-dependent hydrolase